MIHTPGHTPGSQCFLVDGRLVAGDTLFLEGCGRTDFPGSDPLAMYESIHTRLARVPDEAILFPGHLYSQDPSQSMGETRRWNYVFRPRSAEEWMAMFGSMSPSEELPADSTVVVVGASLAGWRAVETLRSEGFDGSISLVGEERHLPYDRPPLSKQVLAGTWPPEKAVLADKRRSSEHRIHEVLGRRAVRLDAEARKVELDDGTVLEGDGFVITTGARPAAPGTEAWPSATACSRCAPSTTRSPSAPPSRRSTSARVVVIGAGFIGAEVASTCADLGCRVTVLEALDVPLRNVLGHRVRLPFRVAARVARCGPADGVGVGVRGIAGGRCARRGGPARRRARRRRDVPGRRRRRGYRRGAGDGVAGRLRADHRQRRRV